jgi:hypothetical protein
MFFLAHTGSFLCLHVKVIAENIVKIKKCLPAWIFLRKKNYRTYLHDLKLPSRKSETRVFFLPNQKCCP